MNYLDAPDGPLDRAADSPHEGASGTAAQPARESRIPAVPGRRQPTVGPADPDAGGPTVHHRVSDTDPGWAPALTLRRAHYVSAWTPRELYYGRETGLGFCGFPGLIDDEGLAAAVGLPLCRACVRQGAPVPGSGERP